jgi:hypothetical protein
MKYFKVLINERYSYISYNTNTTYLQIFFNKVSMYMHLCQSPRLGTGVGTTYYLFKYGTEPAGGVRHLTEIMHKLRKILTRNVR